MCGNKGKAKKKKKEVIKMCEFSSKACDREAADGFLNVSFTPRITEQWRKRWVKKRRDLKKKNTLA